MATKQSRTPKSLWSDGPCVACGQHRGLQRNHIDWNHDNNAPDNVQVLCEWCHKEAHRLGKPQFDELLVWVNRYPELRAALRTSSDDWFRKLPPDRNIRSV